MSATSVLEAPSKVRSQYDHEDEEDFASGLIDDTPPVAAVAKPSAPAPKAEPTLPASAGATATTKYTHSKLMTKLAFQAGIGQEELDETSPEDLDKYLEHLSRQQAAAAAAAKAKEPEPEPEEEVVDLGFDDTYDEKIVAVLTAQEKRIREQEKLIRAREAADAAQRQQQGYTEIDTAFTALKSPLFGEGTYKDIDPAMYRRRKAVIASIQQEPPKGLNSLAEAVAQRANELFGVASPSHDKNKEFKEKWNQGGVAIPTQRSETPQKKGDKAATKEVAKLLRTLSEGVMTPGEESEEETLL